MTLASDDGPLVTLRAARASRDRGRITLEGPIDLTLPDGALARARETDLAAWLRAGGIEPSSARLRARRAIIDESARALDLEDVAVEGDGRRPAGHARLEAERARYGRDDDGGWRFSASRVRLSTRGLRLR